MFSSLFGAHLRARMKAKALPAKKRESKKAPPRESSRAFLSIDGQMQEVTVRLNPRARRMIVKVNPATAQICITTPSRHGLAHALDFARRETSWISGQLAKAAGPVPLAPGTVLPFRGALHEIRTGGPAGSAPVWRSEGAIFVRGGDAHAPRRVLDFLKRQARLRFEERAMAHAAKLGVAPSRISVRDTASRWGSCSSARNLSFSWRLILAPDFVLDYVVAHEVAHLKEMNHSPRFWAHVKSLIADLDAPQAWLKQNGRELQRYAAVKS